MFAAKLIQFFLEYKNDWCSVEAFAEYHGMSVKHANECISSGREYARIYNWRQKNGVIVIEGLA